MLLESQIPGQKFEFTQGDNFVLSLLAVDDFGIPVDLTGATFSSQIVANPPNVPNVFPNGQHSLGNQTTNPGSFTLTLSESDTANCGEGSHHEIITSVTISGNISTFRGTNLLTVYPALPIQ